MISNPCHKSNMEMSISQLSNFFNDLKGKIIKQKGEEKLNMAFKLDYSDK